jgi:hypothetical protein
MSVWRVVLGGFLLAVFSGGLYANPSALVCRQLRHRRTIGLSTAGDRVSPGRTGIRTARRLLCLEIWLLPESKRQAHDKRKAAG